MEQEKEQEAPKKMGRCKKFWLFLLILAILGAVVYFYRDKPCKLVKTADFNAEVDSAAGEIVDYHFAYNALQDEDLGNVEENGWRIILQALGPRALEQDYKASTIPWEEFPTNEDSKDWFDNYWSPLCEKFKLDPKERPTMYGRMDLWSFVAKNGLTGDEPEPDEGAPFGTYCENFESKPAKVDNRLVYDALMKKPWTKEEYPYAAQWFDENADYIDVFARAARSPKCLCWRKLGDLPDANFIGVLLPDAQYTREIARQLVARANYRLGSGDVSGAIDDVETIALFSRAKLESKGGFLVDRLMGIATLSMACGVQIFNSPVPPTDAELARVTALWSEFYRSNFFTSGFADAMDAEKIFSCGCFEDMLVLRRNGVSPMVLFGEEPGEFDWSVEWFMGKAVELALFTAPPVDDAKAFGKYCDLWERMRNEPDFEDELDKREDGVLPWLTSTPETNFAYSAAHFLLPALNASHEAYLRLDCLMRQKAIVCAFLAYQREHGTLPPAFSVDADGKPLHSWRVLILPYLGEEEKALYDEIALDEPWNSERNLNFFDRVPKAYQCPSPTSSRQKRLTSERNSDMQKVYDFGLDRAYGAYFSVLVGRDGFFDESGVGKDLNAALEAKGYDAARQPIIVERGEPVCWMKPDAELRLDHYATGLASDVWRFFKDDRHAGGMNYATPSGATVFLSETTNPDELDALLRGLPEPPKKTEGAEESYEPTPEIEAEEPSDASEQAEVETEEPAVESETTPESSDAAPAPTTEEAGVEETSVEQGEESPEPAE